jgi:hypothetical protein
MAYTHPVLPRAQVNSFQLLQKSLSVHSAVLPLSRAPATHALVSVRGRVLMNVIIFELAENLVRAMTVD